MFFLLVFSPYFALLMLQLSLLLLCLFLLIFLILIFLKMQLFIILLFLYMIVLICFVVICDFDNFFFPYFQSVNICLMFSILLWYPS